jgi:putative methionine-R-sulfoxide reductase with GAF domain
MYRSARRSPVPDIEPPDVVTMPDPSGTPSVLHAIRRQVREIGEEYAETVLQLITEYAVILTGADSAALAFVTDHRMICRARVGETAPPLAASVDVTHGLSGECVRSGVAVSCEDTENDPRIDPETGRTLGIGSVLAVPIASDFAVLGLLEIFSRHPRAFTKDHETVLCRLAEMIPRNLRENAEDTFEQAAQSETIQCETIQSETTHPEAPPGSEMPSQPPAAKSESTESDSIESYKPEPESPESVVIRTAAGPLSEQEPESIEQISQPVPDEIVKSVSDAVPNQTEAESVSPRSKAFNFLRWALFNWAFVALLIAGVSTALGYLVGFAIGKH